VLVLDGLGLAHVDLIVEGGKAVPAVLYLLFKSLVVGLQGLHLALGPFKLRILQRHLLLEGVDLPQEIPFFVLEC
jgi:hypothetical protein